MIFTDRRHADAYHILLPLHARSLDPLVKTRVFGMTPF